MAAMTIRCGVSRRRSPRDRKSTRLNSSHSQISYAVFCLKKKKKAISHSSFWPNTGIFVIEDDVHDGVDDIAHHRIVYFIIFSYTQRSTAYSTIYSTIGFV